MKKIPLKEKDIERYLVNEVKKIKGIAYKFTSPGRRSVPDRILLIHKHPALFVECKRPGGRLTPNQKREIERIKLKGFTVYVVDSIQSVDNLIEQLS